MLSDPVNCFAEAQREQVETTRGTRNRKRADARSSARTPLANDCFKQDRCSRVRKSHVMSTSRKEAITKLEERCRTVKAITPARCAQHAIATVQQVYFFLEHCSFGSPKCSRIVLLIFTLLQKGTKRDRGRPLNHLQRVWFNDGQWLCSYSQPL